MHVVLIQISRLLLAANDRLPIVKCLLKPGIVCGAVCSTAFASDESTGGMVLVDRLPVILQALKSALFVVNAVCIKIRNDGDKKHVRMAFWG